MARKKLAQRPRHLRLSLFLFAAATLVGSLLPFIPALAQLAAPSFTVEQAERGEIAYQKSCAACHGETLSDSAFGPPLKGRAFLQRWGGKSIDQLFIEMATTMPTAAPRSLGDDTYADILAFVLSHNGVFAGESPLAASPKELRAFVLPTTGDSPTGGIAAGVELPPPPDVESNPLDKFSPVKDAMLTDAPAGDWLTWRRTNAAHGYSPLAQINKKNISDLNVAWSWALPEGPSQVPPLVHDGVMFVHGFGDEIQALDAASGRVLWHYARWLPSDADGVYPGKRSIAIHGERLFIPTTDGYVVALDARTGAVAWEQPVADVSKGYILIGGPLIAKGKVMLGTSGQAPGGNYIVGLDIETGEEAWRFNVIERPGVPSGDTWNGIPLEQRNGGSVWIPGTYDAESGLAFFGPAPTYDTGPLLRASTKPGITNDALYTDTTVALDPATGKLVWHYQHFPNDQWDLDWAFERHIVKLPVNGVEKSVIVTAGKIGIFDFLEADSGKYLSSFDVGLQNLVSAIDPNTGAKQIDPSRMPDPERVVTVCPHADGAKNWFPSAYNPKSKVLFVPLMEICMDIVPVGPGEQGALSTGVRWTGRPRPDSDGRYGRLQAINLATGEVEWIRRQRAAHTSGLLATAGGLVFSGDLNRDFAAYDEDTGDKLWHTGLNDVSNAAPISYAVDGKQYIAITVGHGRLAIARSALVPEIQLPAKPSATLWVFALPEG